MFNLFKKETETPIPEITVESDTTVIPKKTRKTTYDEALHQTLKDLTRKEVALALNKFVFGDDYEDKSDEAKSLIRDYRVLENTNNKDEITRKKIKSLEDRLYKHELVERDINIHGYARFIIKPIELSKLIDILTDQILKEDT